MVFLWLNLLACNQTGHGLLLLLLFELPPNILCNSNHLR